MVRLRLTTNGGVSLQIEYLSVRPEHGRSAPMEFHTVSRREKSFFGMPDEIRPLLYFVAQLLCHFPRDTGVGDLFESDFSAAKLAQKL